MISDHSVISWRLIFQQVSPIAVPHEVRYWSKVDKTKFRAAILNFELFSTQKTDCAAGFFDLYHAVLQSLADDFTPVQKVTVQRQRIAVWFDNEYPWLRRYSRFLERRFRVSKLRSDRELWIRHEHK